jgi:hypothetical protein
VTTVGPASIRDLLEPRVEAARGSAAYANYKRVREWILDLPRDRSGTNTASDYWVEELDSLEYLLDASPLVIERLRHHTYTVTGVRPYDYRTNKQTGGRKFEAKLAALKELDNVGLLVPESRALGGFGHEIGGELVNIDTLKFYEALIAMERGGMLAGFRESGDRRVVWEIGAGWGGFARCFKTLFPDVTYVITDLPELFLFSATYLLTLFPDATAIFWGEGTREESALASADFVFVPNTAVHSLSLPHLNLTVNMVSFQEMTSEQVETYVSKAHALGSPLLYSFNRERSVYNPQIESVTGILERWYWTHVVPVLPVSYLKMLDDKAAKRRQKTKYPTELDYRHVAGTRRVLA